VRWIDTNPVYSLEEFRWSEPEMVHIKTPDGFTLEAMMIRPPDWSAARRYPVWCSTYAGPGMPSVHDVWADGRTWDQMLAQEGIVVFEVDPRSASGKGVASAWTAYRRLGVQGLKDLEAAVAWLAGQPWIDASRVGLSGVSYGGFMTSFAMTHSKVFSAGIAGAPVTDWHDYDSIYTERYMDTPQQNPEGYEVTSVVKAASALHGRLLLIHGAIDDNVHFQNTLKLVQGLADADRQFDLMVYPAARHGFWSLHYHRLMHDFIVETMRPGMRRL
jgi:dipeptidyl-peptidase 4